MRLLQKGVCGCPMIFFGWPRLCVGLEAFWQRGFLVYGGYLIYLVARRVVKDTAKADISTHWSVVGCILSGVNHTLGRLRWFHGWCLNILFNKSVTVNVRKSFIPSLTITKVVQRWEVNCLTRQWQERMRPRNDGSLQYRVIPWNGNVSFIGDLGKRHQLPWMSRSVCTSDCVVIDHRLAWRLLPFTKKALEHFGKRLSKSPALDHDYKAEFDQVPRLFKYSLWHFITIKTFISPRFLPHTRFSHHIRNLRDLCVPKIPYCEKLGVGAPWSVACAVEKDLEQVLVCNKCLEKRDSNDILMTFYYQQTCTTLVLARTTFRIAS